MYMKRLMNALVLPLLLLAGQLFAQEKVVTGRVTDSTGAPVSSATVLVKGTKTGTQTNADGAFSIRVAAANATLVISSVGFSPQEVAAGNGTANVILKSAN